MGSSHDMVVRHSSKPIKGALHGHMYTGKTWWSALGLTNYNGQSVVTGDVTYFICKCSKHARNLCCESQLLTNKTLYYMVPTTHQH